MEIASGQRNKMQEWLGYCLGTTAFSMILYHLYYIWSLPYETSIHAIVHLGFAFVILITIRLRKSFQFFHAVMLVVAIWVSIYFLTHYEEILADPSYPPMTALIAGTMAAVIVFILTYETFGWVFPTITALGILYMAYGFHLPVSIRAPSVDLDRIITLLSADVTSPWGVYGKLLILSANYLFLFIFFGATLEAFGGLRFVMSVGSLAASKFRSGAAALSIFSSSLLGSVTGSTVANITITGTFTIPLMKKGGYTSQQAAAIETAASSGGQILPPIMGATVFVMAGYTGIPYITVVKACFIPAIIYFAVLLLYAELNARKLNIAPMPPQKIDMRNLLFDAPIFIVPLVFLLILLVMGFSLMRTIFWCLLIIATIGLLSGMRKEARLDWKKLKDRLINGIISGSQIAVVLALIGVLVATVEVTGLGMRLGNVLVTLSQHNLFLLLIMTAVTAMILGVGIPTPAAYILCATVLSPALIKLGVPLLQAHLFPLYYAVFSHLTPPVGIGLMVACKMANANYMQAAAEALKAALASFLFPFLFVYTPAILLQIDSVSSGIQQFVAVLLSFFNLSLLLNAYWATRMNLAERSIFLFALCTLFIFVFVTQNYLLLIMAGGITIAGIALNLRSYTSSLIVESRK